MIKYQKVIKVGNSLAVTLDQGFATQAGLHPGDQVAISYKPQEEVMSLSKATQAFRDKLPSEEEAIVSARVTPEFQKWVEQSLAEDEEAMRKLKDL